MVNSLNVLSPLIQGACHEQIGSFKILGNGVLKLDKILKEKETVIGYIFGGIVTDGYAVGIDGTVTNATNQIFKVTIQQRY